MAVSSSSMASISRFLHKTSTFQARPSLCQISMRQANLDERNYRISVPNARKEGNCNLDLSLASSISPVVRSRQVLCKAEANISSGNVPEHAPEKLSLYERIVELLTTLFPVWVILGTVIGIYKPSMVTWLETDLFTVGLGFLMLSMEFNDEPLEQYIPGLHPLRSSDLNTLYTLKQWKKILQYFPSVKKPKCVLFTSFYELESDTIDLIKQQLPCHAYHIGPCVPYLQLNAVSNPDQDYYLTWLDEQPKKSVLYISLGIFLSVSQTQLEELAYGFGYKSG